MEAKHLLAVGLPTVYLYLASPIYDLLPGFTMFKFSTPAANKEMPKSRATSGEEVKVDGMVWWSGALSRALITHR